MSDISYYNKEDSNTNLSVGYHDNGGRIMSLQHHYVEAGSGEPLLLLHGNGESHEYFVHQIEYFRKKYRVIAIDTRGHGRTPRGKAPFTIRQFSEDLRCFMDAHEIPKAHILGFSDGGNIAMIFALKYPDYVDKLILNGANLYPGGVKPSVQLPIVIGYHVAGLFARISANAGKNAELLELMVKEPNLTAKELKRIRAKTLVIAGTKDMIKPEHTQLIAKNIPDAKLVFVPGDHFIANKNAEVFNREVESFLRQAAGVI